MPKYEIVFATYNGSKRISRTLDSIKQAIEESSINTNDIRVLLIDNASTDDTKEVAQKYLDQLRLDIIDAPNPGKSRALNKAIQHFQGEIIFFTDDDTEFEPKWLDNFIRVIEAHPRYSIFAGKIVGKWEVEIDPTLASWIPMGSTYAVHDREDSGPCEPGLVWGPNMAVRRAVFEKGIKFNEEVGPQPASLYPMGQDTEFATKAVEQGFKSYFVSEAVVRHTIKASTANEDWVIRRAERLGYGIFAVKKKADYKRKLPEFLPLSIELFYNRLFWTVTFPFTKLLPRSKQRFWVKWRYYYYRGLWKGYKRFA